MTKRERYLTVLGKGRADRLTWAPNLDHWLDLNKKHGTVPEKYRDLARNDIVRAAGGTIWARTGVLRSETKNVAIEEIRSNDGKEIKTVYKTPVGNVYTTHQEITDERYMTGHMIKSVDDIAVVKFMAENTEYSVFESDFAMCEAEVGDDGISLVSLPYCMPFIQFGKTDCGWETGLYLYYDHTQAVEDLMETYSKKIEQAAALVAGTGVRVVQLGDNMDELTVSPTLFKTYALPFYKIISNILHEGDKLFQVHWCGRTKMLLNLAVGSGIDIIEAVSVHPLDTIYMPEVLDKTGDIIIQGGVPSVMMCPQSATRDELADYIKNLLAKVPHGEKFVLGMSDNVPPNADFSRVEMISGLVNAL